MARQKSEDRVVPDGGVMPVQLVRDGGQGKAVSVDETAVQLSLAIATADDHFMVPDRYGAGRVVVPKAIVNAGKVSPATMEHARTSPPPTRHNWRYGDDSRSQTGRRRGS